MTFLSMYSERVRVLGAALSEEAGEYFGDGRAADVLDGLRRRGWTLVQAAPLTAPDPRNASTEIHISPDQESRIEEAD